MRALMGFGEAGFTSIAPTVLGDLYSPEDRTVVLALFYYAIPVGRYEQRLKTYAYFGHSRITTKRQNELFLRFG